METPDARHLLDEAVFTDAPEERRRKLDEAIAALLRETPAAPTASADLTYLLGYASYLHPDFGSSSERRAMAKRALVDATLLDPKHPRAHLYLGHIAYDEGDYEHARQAFLVAAGPGLGVYLEGKRAEMLVCCTLWIDGLSAALDGMALRPRRDRLVAPCGSPRRARQAHGGPNPIAPTTAKSPSSTVRFLP